jgi:hypothetical protein
MNGMAATFVPSDEQVNCWHMAGIVPRPSGGGNIVDHNNTDLVDTLGGYRFNFCPLCGARLEVKSETAHRQFKEDEMKTENVNIDWLQACLTVEKQKNEVFMNFFQFE